MTKIRISLKPSGYTWVTTSNDQEYMREDLYSFKGHTTDLAEIVARLEYDLAKAKTRGIGAGATVRKLTRIMAYIRNSK